MAKVCIYGVGAIGGYIAARLSLSGQNVVGIARGRQLDAIRQNGLTLIEADQTRTAEFHCTDQPAEAGPQDFILLTMKSHRLPAVAEDMRPLLGADTVVVTVYNGFPWWYFYALEASGKSAALDTVDPSGRLWNLIGPQRVIGSVVYPAARIVEPGVVAHVYGDRFTLGEPDGSTSERIGALATIFKTAGFDTPVISDIRTEIWTKLVANVAYNPVSLLVGATVSAMLDDPAIADLFERMMTEASAVAEATGTEVPVQPRQLMDLTRPVGAHKTSMLQDLEAGRSVELDTIAGAIQELGKRYQVPTPTVDQVLALARQRARLAGCY